MNVLSVLVLPMPHVVTQKDPLYAPAMKDSQEMGSTALVRITVKVVATFPSLEKTVCMYLPCSGSYT